MLNREYLEQARTDMEIYDSLPEEVRKVVGEMNHGYSNLIVIRDFIEMYGAESAIKMLGMMDRGEM